MGASAIYRRTPNAVAADLGEGQLAIMGLARGRYYALNPVGRVIWDFLGTPHTREEIRARVLSQFEVDEQACERDVDKFLKELLDEGLAETVPA
jgi:hypothetical protein